MADGFGGDALRASATTCFTTSAELWRQAKLAPPLEPRRAKELERLEANLAASRGR